MEQLGSPAVAGLHKSRYGNRFQDSYLREKPASGSGLEEIRGVSEPCYCRSFRNSLSTFSAMRLRLTIFPSPSARIIVGNTRTP